MKYPTPTDAVLALRDARLQKDKRDLLISIWHAGQRDLFRGFQAALDPTRHYGGLRVPEYEIDGTETPEELQGGDLTWDALAKLLDRLDSGDLTGVAAEQAVVNAAEQTGMLDWNLWYRAILLREDFGLSAKAINQALKKIGRDAAGYRVPTLDVPEPVPLAKHRGGLMGRKYLEPRLHGRRVTVIIRARAGRVQMFGGEQEPVEPSEAMRVGFVSDEMRGVFTTDLVLDGWLTGVSFRTHMIRAEAGTEYLALTDAVPLEAFRSGYDPTPLRERQAFLASLQGRLQAATAGFVWVLPKLIVDTTTEDGRANLRDFRDECLGAGYEAVLIKDPESGYGSKGAVWIEVSGTDRLGFLD